VTDDLLSVLQTKVNIFAENAERGMVTEEGVAAWKQAQEFFVTQRLRQDLPEAIPLLSSSDEAVRKNAVRGMAEAGKRGIDLASAATALAALLSESDPDVRALASGALTYQHGRTGDWPGVQTLLASGDMRVRAAACEALISVERAEASLTSSLGTLLQDAEAEVRKIAAIAVATLPRKGVDATSLVPRMIELLTDAEPTVRRSAAFAFSLWSKHGLRDYCAPALPVLRSVTERDDNDAVRHFAAQVLAASEDEDSVSDRR
jgi:HEAT repeat protein